jgi:hypothetical protein
MGTGNKNNKANKYKFIAKRELQLETLSKTLKSVQENSFKLGLLKRKGCYDHKNAIEINLPLICYRVERDLTVRCKIIQYNCVIIHDKNFNFASNNVNIIRSRHLIHNIKKHVKEEILPAMEELVSKYRLDLRLREPTPEEALKRAEITKQNNLFRDRNNGKVKARTVVYQDDDSPKPKITYVSENMVRRKKKATTQEQQEKLAQVKIQWENKTTQNDLVTFRVNKAKEIFMSGVNNIKPTSLLDTEEFGILDMLYLLKTRKDGSKAMLTENQLEKIRRREKHEKTVREQAEKKIAKALSTKARLAEENEKRLQLYRKKQQLIEEQKYIWDMTEGY